MPGVRSQMRSAVARAAAGSSPRIPARPAANSATAARSDQSGIERENSRSIVAALWSGRSLSTRPGATGRVPARVSAENASGWSSAATWATMRPRSVSGRARGRAHREPGVRAPRSGRLQPRFLEKKWGGAPSGRPVSRPARAWPRRRRDYAGPVRWRRAPGPTRMNPRRSGSRRRRADRDRRPAGSAPGLAHRIAC